jgi:hypothetical protein
MADQYVVKATVGRLELDLIDMPCQTEREALAKAGDIFDQFEGNARIEILLNDMPPPLWGGTRLEEWNREGCSPDEGLPHNGTQVGLVPAGPIF